MKNGKLTATEVRQARDWLERRLLLKEVRERGRGKPPLHAGIIQKFPPEAGIPDHVVFCLDDPLYLEHLLEAVGNEILAIEADLDALNVDYSEDPETGGGEDEDAQ